MIKWYGPQVKAGVETVLAWRLAAVGARGRTAAIRKISRLFRGAGAEVRYRPRRTGTASAPGEPPKRDIGELAQSIGYEVDRKELAAYIGTFKKYGFWLEVGTKKMAARPYLRPMLSEQLKSFMAILERPFRKLPPGTKPAPRRRGGR